MTRAVRWLALASLIIPAAANVSVAVSWQKHHLSPITGDEPHYLIVANALTVDRSLDVRRAYARDAADYRILGPMDSQNHSTTGTRGTFSIHDVGVPALIAPIFHRFGLRGVRMELALIAGMASFLVFAIARSRAISFYESIVLSLSLTLGLPYLAAAGQIYPDLICGIVVLALAAIAITGRGRQTSLPASLLAGLLVAALPWLHLKNLPAAIVLGGAILLVERGASGRWRASSVALVISPLLLAIIALAAYRIAAFGGSGSALTATAIAGGTIQQASMIFLGLHFDQLAGVFANQPLLLLGLPGLVVFWRRDRLLFWALLATYLSLAIPNAFHPCWYGCRSIGSRFTWSIAGLWVVPFLFLYAELSTFARGWILAACGAGVGLQIALMHRWFHRGSAAMFSTMTNDLYQRASLVTPAWRPFLPSYVDFAAYMTSAPNLVVGLLAIAFISAGVLLARRLAVAGTQPAAAPRAGWYVAAGVLLVTVSGAERVWSQVASIDLIERFATADKRPRNSGPETFKIEPEVIAGQSQPAIYARAPTRIIWNVTVPEDGVLSVSLGIDERAWTADGDGVVFRVGVSGPFGYHEVLSQHVDPHGYQEDRRWVGVTVDLSAYAGPPVQLIFSTDASPPGANDNRNDFAYWGSPVVRRPY